MNKLIEAWGFLRSSSLVKCESEEFFNSEEQIEILPPLKKTSQPESRSVEHPHQQRTAQVFDSLDQASKQGLKTYTDLIDYVRQKTGQGCSRKLVSKWKKERGLAANHLQSKALANEIQSDCPPETQPDETQADNHTETKSFQTPPSKVEKPQASLIGKVVTAATTVGAGLLLFSAFSYGYSDRTTTQTTPQTFSQNLPLAPIATASNSNIPKTLKFSLSLSSPKDLKVKEGDTVTAGEVVARRVDEESQLQTERQTLTLEYQKLQAKEIPNPIAPVPVPTVRNLPAISYAEEETAITAAAMNVQQAERILQVQQEKLKAEPLEESAALQRAAVEVQNRQRIVDNQLRTIDGVALLKNLPPEVAAHEQEVLKQKQAELEQAQAEYQQAQAKLSAARADQTEKLQELGTALSKARADHQLAIAKLQTKKDLRAHAEYEASLATAQRAEEQNQTAQSYSRQLLEAEQQRRDRWFQLAQIQAKIDEVNEKIQTASVITSPYSGLVRRIKIQRQSDKILSAELTLAVDNSSSSDSTKQLPLRASSPIR